MKDSIAPAEDIEVETEIEQKTEELVTGSDEADGEVAEKKPQ